MSTEGLVALHRIIDYKILKPHFQKNRGEMT